MWDVEAIKYGGEALKGDGVTKRHSISFTSPIYKLSILAVVKIQFNIEIMPHR